MTIEIAPDECIVCGKKPPLLKPGQKSGWAYLAGAKPLGSMACSPECTEKAIERVNRTGRCDES